MWFMCSGTLLRVFNKLTALFIEKDRILCFPFSVGSRAWCAGIEFLGLKAGRGIFMRLLRVFNNLTALFRKEFM